MRMLVVVLAAFALAACTGLGMSNDYKGQDAGFVIVGIGTNADATYKAHMLLFRSLKSGQQGNFNYSRELILGDTPDYKNDSEMGVVKVASLPAGEYELFNYNVIAGGAPVFITHSSKADFSIKFTVKPNQSVYLGNYKVQNYRSIGKFGIPISTFAGFVVDDRQQTDLSIAKKANIYLPIEEVINKTPKMKVLSMPDLSQEEGRRQ